MFQRFLEVLFNNGARQQLIREETHLDSFHIVTVRQRVCDTFWQKEQSVNVLKTKLEIN